MKEQIPIAQSSTTNLLTAATEIKNLKDYWQNKTKIDSELKEVVKNPNLAKSNIKLEDKQKTISIEAKNLNNIEYDMFGDKIINKSLVFKSISFKREGDYNASMKLEVAK
jgi:hypothetical protein